MKKTVLFTFAAFAFATFAFAHCGNCPGDKKEAAKAAAPAPGKDCGDCPSHRKTEAAKAGGHNCPLDEKGAAKAEGHNCPGGMEGVQKSVKNIEKGAEMIFTAKDKALVEKIQQLVAGKHSAKGGSKRDCPCRVSGADTRIENMADGVKVVITGKAPGIVKKIQELAARKSGHKCGASL